MNLKRRSYSFIKLITPPQKLIGEPDTLYLSVNDQLAIGSHIGGQYTHYQWQKQENTTWTDIQGAIDSVFQIGAFKVSDTGIYRCTATSDQVTGLTLFTGPVG